MTYKITRTNRKTIAIYVRKNGEVEVRAPLRVSDKKIQEFVREKEDWITKTQNKITQILTSVISNIVIVVVNYTTTTVILIMNIHH
jgi:predicted metal-dependent hydrolase